MNKVIISACSSMDSKYSATFFNTCRNAMEDYDNWYFNIDVSVLLKGSLEAKKIKQYPIISLGVSYYF